MKEPLLYMSERICNDKYKFTKSCGHCLLMLVYCPHAYSCNDKKCYEWINTLAMIRKLND